MNKLLTWFLDLLYPPKCIFCGKLLKESETDLCRKCRFALPEVEGSMKRGEFFEKCWSLYYYEEFVAESVRRFKFHGMQQYAQGYGRLLAMMILRTKIKFDVLSWVPIGKKRLKKRGYDQAALLAKAVAGELKVPCVRTLIKVRENPAQSSINGAAERRANVLGAYRVCQGEKIKGKRILLLDDVLTTGATLSECSRVLLTEGASSVVCATVAATRQKEKQ